MALNFILDAAIVLILLIGIILGVKRGFVATVSKPVRIVASIGVAFGLCRPVGEQYVQPYIQKPLVERMTSFLQETCADLTAESASSELPTILKLVAKIFNVDINTVAEEATASIVDAVVVALAGPVAEFAAIIVSFVVLYLVTNIVCFILLKLIDLVLNFGPLEIINKVLGLLIGAVFSFILVWALTVGFDYVATLDMFKDNEMIQTFTGGPVYQLIRKLNPIDLLFKF